MEGWKDSVIIHSSIVCMRLSECPEDSRDGEGAEGGDGGPPGTTAGIRSYIIFK